MNMLAKLTVEDDIKEEVDSLGSGFVLLNSGLYEGIVKLAFISTADSEALALNVTIQREDETEVTQQFWMTSGKAKGCKNYYEKDGVKNYLPGFLLANSLCQLTTGKGISELETEVRVVNLWNKDAKAKIPTKVNMVVDVLNKPIVFGIIKQTVDKNAKNDAGMYVATGETREENEIDKFFRAEDRMTVAEIKAKADVAVFADTWATKWTGVVKNKVKGAAAGAGKPGAPAGTGGAPKPKTSLFS